MAPLKPLFTRFYPILGQRLQKLNFPDKIVRGTNFFQQKTDVGYVGIHIAPIYRTDVGFELVIQVAIANTEVQNLLEQTELYDSDGSLTWSCGADLTNIRDHFGAIPKLRFAWGTQRVEKLIKHNRKHEVFVDANVKDEAAELNRAADQAFGYVAEFAWPFLQKYGFSNESLLELTLRNDEYSRQFFLEPRKPLTGLILARHLGRFEVMPRLIDQARKDYGEFASLGNSRPLDSFERIVAQLRLLSD